MDEKKPPRRHRIPFKTRLLTPPLLPEDAPEPRCRRARFLYQALG
jgi:hypothetical protein